MDIESFKKKLLVEAYEPYTKFSGCPVKSFGCKRLVFGEGNPDASIMLVGEGPGRDEDLKGRPFIGRAGILLTKILEKCGLKREETFITNVVKCRPPDNRKPLNEEIQFYKKLLFDEIKIIRPKVICTLGATALEAFVKDGPSISQTHGKTINMGNIKLLPTFHPAYILRNQKMELHLEKDIEKAFAISKEKNHELSSDQS